MRIRVLNKQCKEIEIDVPSGYEPKVTGDARRGDIYWNWPRGSWMPVEDSHSFLGIRASAIKTLLTPIYAATHELVPMTERCGRCGMIMRDINKGRVTCPGVVRSPAGIGEGD